MYTFLNLQNPLNMPRSSYFLSFKQRIQSFDFFFTLTSYQFIKFQYAYTECLIYT